MTEVNMLRKIISLFLVLSATQIVVAQSGTSSGGGGDDYTIDFLQTLENEVTPWLFGQNGHLLPKGLTKKLFADHLAAIAEKVESKATVYESCDQSTNGRQVVICYNYIEDKYYISRTLYPLDKRNSLSKWLLLAHELKRRIVIDKKPIEGDKYEVTRKLSVQNTNPEAMTNCIIELYEKAGFASSKLRKLAFLSCERTAADLKIQSCIVKLVTEIGFSEESEKIEAVHACEISTGSDSLIFSLDAQKANLTTPELRGVALKNWFEKFN